jgi:hypothetical protein
MKKHATGPARWLGVATILTVSAASGATRTVGPGGSYPKPCAAIAAAADGDVIEIDAAGSYAGDVCQISKNGLTLRGVKGRPKIDAAGQNSGGKATWVISGNDTTVENVEFSGAAVSDANGAGIRQEGANLTVRGCYFHDNQDGILAGDDASSQILIENTEFDHNGAGDGYSHNLYINHVGKLIFQYNYSHRAVAGHLLKSRAAETHVLYNRLTGESDGTQSYEIDVPNGGKTYVIGNLVEQGANTGNPAMLAYGEEGANAANPSDALFVVNNTFVNDRGSGTFVLVGDAVKTPVHLVNNVFSGGGTKCSQPNPVDSASFTGSAPGFANAAQYDYHLVDGSPCIGAGVAPGTDGSFSLAPNRQYVHPVSSEGRTTVGTIDVGAYEFGGGEPGDGGSTDGGGAGGANGIAGGANPGGASGANGVAGGASSNGGMPNNSAGGGRSSDGGTVATSGGVSAGSGAAAGENSGDSVPMDAGTNEGKDTSSACGCRAVARGAPARAGVVSMLLVGLFVRRRRATRLVAKLRAL